MFSIKPLSLADITIAAENGVLHHQAHFTQMLEILQHIEVHLI
jgi:hypothetical protein